MFDLSFTELLLVAVVGVIVIGPKELPVVVRTVSRWVRDAKSVAADLYNEFHRMGEDTGIHEAKREFEAEARYIIDDEGRRQQVYDISDFLKESPTVTGAEDEHGRHGPA